jgi:hypothetical protein
MTTAVKNHSSNDDQLLVASLRKYYAGYTEDAARKDLENKYGAVWDDKELLTAFGVQVFDGPLVHVIRRADGARGTVAFIDTPRLYFAFAPDSTTGETN